MNNQYESSNTFNTDYKHLQDKAEYQFLESHGKSLVRESIPVQKV